jgi:hypothetical protein
VFAASPENSPSSPIWAAGAVQTVEDVHDSGVEPESPRGNGVCARHERR